MPNRPIRDASLFVEVIGHGYPLLLMHGGPGADHWTLTPLRRLADRYTLVFYDHRCNGRSTGAPVESMTWANLTADADALRRSLGFEQWAVLGHSFGGHVALEYALRYPASVSHLVLLDTGGDSHWSLQNAAEVLAERGFSAGTVKLARRWFNGRVEPRWFLPTLLRLGRAYNPYQTLPQLAHGMIEGEWRTKLRPEALIFAARTILPGWTVMDRLGEIAVPTLVMAGRDDFIFPPEHQAQLAASIPDARLRIIDRAGHNPQSERTAEVVEALRAFLSAASDLPRSGAAMRTRRSRIVALLAALGLAAAAVTIRRSMSPTAPAPPSLSARVARQAWRVGQPQTAAAAATMSPTRKKVGCRKLNSPMMRSSRTIQIIWAQPMPKARNGAAGWSRTPSTATASEPTPKRPARMRPGTR
jgi:proline iminopeptidase